MSSVPIPLTPSLHVPFVCQILNVTSPEAASDGSDVSPMLAMNKGLT